MRTPTPLAEVAQLIDAYHAGDTSVYCRLAYALVNAGPDDRLLLAFARHGRVWTANMGEILVRKLVELEEPLP